MTDPRRRVRPPYRRVRCSGQPAGAIGGGSKARIGTRSPSTMPRAAASSGCRWIGARPATLSARLSAEWSSWLCSLVWGWSDSRCSGKRAASGAPSHSAGSNQAGRPGQSGSPTEAIRSLNSSIRPLGVASGFASGSHRRPERLLAVIGALQRPGHVDQAAGGGELGRQRAQPHRRHVGDRAGPVGVAHHAVDAAQQVVAPALEAHAPAGQEGAVVAVGPQRLAGERQHHRRVGVRPDRNPFGRVARHLEVAAHRTEVDEATPGRRQCREPARQVVVRGAARGDLRVLGGCATEGQEQSRVCSASVRQSCWWASRWSIGATTCGSRTRPAPRL